MLRTAAPNSRFLTLCGHTMWTVPPPTYTGKYQPAHVLSIHGARGVGR